MRSDLSDFVYVERKELCSFFWSVCQSWSLIGRVEGYFPCIPYGVSSLDLDLSICSILHLFPDEESKALLKLLHGMA